VKHLPPPYLCAVRVSVDGQLATSGSGLLVGPDLVLTALHVIITPSSADTEHDLDQPLQASRALSGALADVAVGSSALERSAFRNALLHGVDAQHDLALLKLDKPMRMVAPPALADGREPVGMLVFHGYRDGKFRTQEMSATAHPVLRLMDDGETPASFTLSGDLPTGYSGGPVITVEADGSHRLWGVSAFGGTGAARLGFTGWGAVRALLSRHKCLAGLEALSRRAVVPGVPAEVCLPVAGGPSLAFRPCDQGDRPRFRARTPVSAALADHLAGRPARPGASALPAHLVDADEVTALVAALSAAAGETLRLPRLEDLTALGDAHGTLAVDVGLPLRLAVYERSLAPPVGSVEWVEGDGGQPEAWQFRRDGETRLAVGELPSGHTRFAVRPLLLGD
jgi:hypothetical protein